MSGGAGEFGHVVVDPNGPLCDCGKHGCLESYLSDRALLATAREQVSADVRDIDDLVKRASDENQAALNMLASAGILLGQEVANLVNILDPKLIISAVKGCAWEKPFLNHCSIHWKEYHAWTGEGYRDPHGCLGR